MSSNVILLPIAGNGESVVLIKPSKSSLQGHHCGFAPSKIDIVLNRGNMFLSWMPFPGLDQIKLQSDS